MAVNVRLLKQTIAEQAGEKIASRANQAIKLNFNTQKEKLLNDFDNHPVTQELEAGPDVEHSEFFHTDKGGNLFSLIGFDRDKTPTKKLRQILDKGITIDTSAKKVTVAPDGRLKVVVPISIITLQEVYDATASNKETQVPWNKGRSFVQMIQRGITGFGSYVAGMFESPKPSRSGGGVQAKKGGKPQQVRDIDLPGIPYVNELLGDFKKHLANLFKS
jgi:hypothetical protein